MRSSKGFLLRVLPFFATFAIGLFIASFFVNISAPSFRGSRGGKWHRVNRLKVENQELKNENLRLKNEIENLRLNALPAKHTGHDALENLVDLVPPPPAPPAAPRVRQ